MQNSTLWRRQLFAASGATVSSRLQMIHALGIRSPTGKAMARSHGEWRLGNCPGRS